MENFTYQFYSTTLSAWDTMYEALLNATASIYWEIYIFWDDKVGKRFVELLCEKARNGLRVKLVLDTIGSRLMSRRSIGELRAAGVEVLWYNTISPEWRFGRWINRLWRRNHRKVLIIDEKTAFIGGVNIAFSATDWYDLHLRIEGEVIRPLLTDFARTYTSSGGSKEEVEKFLTSEFIKNSPKDEVITFINSSPYFHRTHRFLKKFYIKAVNSAEKEFTIITPYYIPHRRFLRAIGRARKRGVMVNIITPVRSDHRLLDYMASYFLELSEKIGAHIFLLPTMNHAKGFLVDDSLGLIGSSNFTYRSFHANAEADVLFKDKAMIANLSIIVEHWKEEAARGYRESGKKERPIRSGLLGKLAQYFQDYV
jgi:cardiolipin synthase